MCLIQFWIAHLRASAKRSAYVFRLHNIRILHPIYEESLHYSRVKVRHDESGLVSNGDLGQDVPDEGAEPGQDDFMRGHQAALAPHTHVAHSVAFVKQCLHLR